MKITRIVNGQEMEFELTDSELRTALVNTLFSPEKDGVLAEEAGAWFSDALFDMDEEMACAVSPSEYTMTELVGTRITERLQDALAEAAQEYADRYKAIVEWAERHDEATIQASIKAVQRRTWISFTASVGTAGRGIRAPETASRNEHPALNAG